MYLCHESYIIFFNPLFSFQWAECSNASTVDSAETTGSYLDIKGLRSATCYRLAASARTSVGMGPLSPLTESFTTCSGKIWDFLLCISVPHHSSPGNYALIINCHLFSSRQEELWDLRFDLKEFLILPSSGFEGASNRCGCLSLTIDKFRGTRVWLMCN